MYRDNTLIPTEAIRLAALGALIEDERRYADLASEIRNFVGRVAGPSLDLLGTSLEVMGYEGLAEMQDVDGPGGALLRITDAGRKQFVNLMISGVRAPVSDVSKLISALKMRFLHLLDQEDRLDQFELMREMSVAEAVRLRDLRDNGTTEGFSEWLSFEIGQLESRIAWLDRLADG
jgi:DNA-binding PadR family transcriptional regulator